MSARVIDFTMSEDQLWTDHRRHIPSVDVVVHDMGSSVDRWGHDQVSSAVRRVLAQARADLKEGRTAEISIAALRQCAEAALQEAGRPTLRPAINLTGTVLHTNLGRAWLPQEAVRVVVAAARSCTTLEFDLETGERGERDNHVESLICELTGAEAATVVNNNAAAVLLTLNTLAMNREVPTSRGELVEIGGSFRIPEIMTASGCRLVEIGTTNRTHLGDYEAAITADTALLMKVHTSNYRIDGFTHAVEEIDLAVLAHQHGLPLVVDMGSDNLVDFARFGLPLEPTVLATVSMGADVVTFSGDKLLGGPQCGVITGRKDLIAMIRKNPLKWALRLDKMSLVALVEVLRLYRSPASLRDRLPTLRLLTRPVTEIKAQAERLLPQLSEAVGSCYQVGIAACRSQVGSGALCPVQPS